MTTLTASDYRAARRARASATRRARLRAIFDRVVAAAQADTARRSTLGMPDHLLRDLGLTRGDLDVLDL